MSSNSFIDAYKRHTKSVSNIDSLENRLDFMESVLTYKGKTVHLHDIHINMQRCAWEWQQEGRHGIILIPFGTGKTVQVTHGLTVVKTTINKRNRTMTVSSGDSNSKKNGRAIRGIINSVEYKDWCEKMDIEPLRYHPDNDNDSVRELYFDGNDTGDASIGCWWLMAKDAIGSRCEELVLDDFVSPKSRHSKAQRDQDFETINQVYMSRLVDPDTPIISVCTPWHHQDANFKLLDTGDWACLKIKVHDNKDRYVMEEYKPHKGELFLHRKDYDMPLWSFKHNKAFFEREQRKDAVAYARNYELNEKAKDVTKLVYPNYSDLMESYNDLGENIGGNVTTITYDPSGSVPYLTMDFNIALQGWSLVQRMGSYDVVVKEFAGLNKLTPAHALDVAKELKSMGVKKLRVRGDATSWWTMRRSGKSEFDQVKEALKAQNIAVRLDVPRSNPDVESRILHTNKWLLDVNTNHRRLLINENCKYVRNDFKEVAYKDNGEIQKDPTTSHMTDGIGYHVMREEVGSSYYGVL